MNFCSMEPTTGTHHHIQKGRPNKGKTTDTLGLCMSRYIASVKKAQRPTFVFSASFSTVGCSEYGKSCANFENKRSMEPFQLHSHFDTQAPRFLTRTCHDFNVSKAIHYFSIHFKIFTDFHYISIHSIRFQTFLPVFPMLFNHNKHQQTSIAMPGKNTG